MSVAPPDFPDRHEGHLDQLAAYLDGELPPAQIPALELHLWGCRRCRRELALQQAVRGRLARQGVERAPTALRELIRERLRARRRPPHALRGALPWLGWALAAGMALALGVAALLPAGRAPVPMVASAVADYRAHLSRELPAATNADLASLAAALPFRVEPISSLRERLIAAWRTTIRGEPAAALAYRVGDRIVVQYVVSKGLFLRQPGVREAVAARGRYVASVGHDRVLAWLGRDSGSLLVGTVPAAQLEALRL